MTHRIFNGKKGGDDTNASTVLISITLLLLLYVILIPPSYRSAILGGNFTEDNTSALSFDKVFLVKNPGYWTYNSLDSYDHDLLPFNLLAKSDAKLIEKKAYLLSKKTLFSSQIASVEFQISDLKEVSNVFVNYKIKAINGEIKLKVNDNVIKVIKSDSEDKEDSVKIDKLDLREGMDVISFVPESPGFAFWESNFISLEEVKIFGDLVDLTGLKNKQTFWISHDEMLNIKDASLRFYVGCRDAGVLNILLNGDKIYSGIPECNILNMIKHLDLSNLHEGSNTIEFIANQGKFTFDNLLLQTNLKKSSYPTYYFQISSSDFNIIKNNPLNISLNVIFADSENYKEIEFVLNGHSMGVNTYKREYSLSINPIDLREGNNVLEVKPKSNVNIAEIKLTAHS